MKRAILLMAVLAMTAAPGYAATDVHAVGQGTGTTTFGSSTSSGKVTCSGPLIVSLHVTSNIALLTEDWGPSNPVGADCSAVLLAGGQYQGESAAPAVQQCATAPLPQPLPSHIEISIIPQYVLAQTSSTYTLKGVLRSCDGKTTLTDTISIIVKTAQLVYSHILTTATSAGTTTDIKTTGTLSRVA